jgi:hypothetical protein
MLTPSGPADVRAREASAALRFLMDHRAPAAIERAIDRELPPVDWASVSRYGTQRDSLGRVVLALAGVEYVPEYHYQPEGWFHLAGGGPIRVAGYAWLVALSANDPASHLLGGDTVQVVSGVPSGGRARVRIGPDTVAFDLRPVVRRYADSVPMRTGMQTDPIVIAGDSGRRRTALVLTNLSGQLDGDSLSTWHWIGTLLVGD